MLEISESPSTTLFRPGIRPETLSENGIRHVEAEEASRNVGLHRSGLLIPYLNCEDEPVYVESDPFVRLRLDEAMGDQRYHQKSDTGVHAYIPSGLVQLHEFGEPLVVVEGEFKALALMEEGIPAVGIVGFFGFCKEHDLVHEMEQLLDLTLPVNLPSSFSNQLLFLGDSDTALNYQFAHAAVRFKQLVPDVKISLPRLPLEGPKGIDDLKQLFLEETNDAESGKLAFLREWEKICREAIEVTNDEDPRDLAMTLFRSETEALKGFQGEKRTWALRKMATLASFMDSVAANEVTDVAVEMKFVRRNFTATVKEEKEKRRRERTTESVEFDVDEEEVWYAPDFRRYWILAENENWISLDEKSISRWLVDKDLSTKVAEGAKQSPLDENLLKIQIKKHVDMALPLAGHRKGVQRFGGNRILVTREANRLEPVEGEWGLLRDVVEALLKDVDDSMIPVYVFYEWLRIFLECQEKGIFRNGQVLVLAGPIDCGKSLLQNLLTVLFGGREGRPYQYASGGTSFNADLAHAEHLVIEDEDTEGNHAVRKKTGALLKQYAANKMTRVHPKGKDAYVVELLNRLTMTMNDDPQNLGILPPIDESLSDKVILLRAHKRDLPRKPGDSDEYVAFPEDLKAQLPAFKNYLLNEFECPDELKCPRFGVDAYQDPDLLAEINGIGPEERFQTLLECRVGTLLPIGNESTSHSAAELVMMLTSEDFPCREEAVRLLQAHESLERAAVAVGTFMGNLRKKSPELVDVCRTSSSRTWLINPEEADAEHGLSEES
jgi:hypothetical protein